MITNRADAEAFIKTSLTDYADEHDVTAIADELYNQGETWDIEGISDERYWAIVAKHGR